MCVWLWTIFEFVGKPRDLCESVGTVQSWNRGPFMKKRARYETGRRARGRGRGGRAPFLALALRLPPRRRRARLAPRSRNRPLDRSSKSPRGHAPKVSLSTGGDSGTRARSRSKSPLLRGTLCTRHTHKALAGTIGGVDEVLKTAVLRDVLALASHAVVASQNLAGSGDFGILREVFESGVSRRGARGSRAYVS